MIAHIKIFLLLFLSINACKSTEKNPDTPPKEEESIPIPALEIQTAADQPAIYLPKLANKRVGLVVNQTSMTSEGHLVDFLLSKEINVVKIFAPEHGFRGEADAGEHVKDSKDTKTGLSILSLHGKNKKPSSEQLNGIDLVVFDIQDVGARFYTYISTMSYVMEACAEKDIPVMIFDRPNPNGHYVDGPVLKDGFDSFVGLHKIPVVHGMTVGEYALMVNGEGWLKNGVRCALDIIPCANYKHSSFYQLPVRPSPNLPNMTSIYLYPSLCFFEGTSLSVGRGTDTPFQLFGHPDYTAGTYRFTPKPNFGAKYPKHDGKECVGQSLANIPHDLLQKEAALNIDYLINAYKILNSEDFFLENNFFNKLAGNDTFMQQIKDGLSAEKIRVSWQADLEAFKKIRKQYLLYQDFE